MQLSNETANALCQRVVQELVAWRTLPAILQVGGIESRASSRILLALEGWLEGLNRTDLLVLPEYRLSGAPPTDETTDSTVVQAVDRLLRGKRIDYALVKSASVGQAKLEVDTVIEVKTNYLCQPELRNRPLAACTQARTYGEMCGTRDTYVLYIVASPVGAAPVGPRDAGWGYYRLQRPQAVELGPIAVDAVQVLGQHPANDDGHQFDHGDISTEIWACVLQRQ